MPRWARSWPPSTRPGCAARRSSATPPTTWWKSILYEGAAGVPLLFSWPGHFPAGLVLPQPVSLLDLAPTLVDLGGAIPLPDASVRVLTPLLRGQALPTNE